MPHAPELRVGKELDNAIVEQVLGSTGPGMEKAFSTDLRAAWEIVDFVCNQSFRFEITGKKFWQARFYKSVSHTLETQAFLATGREPAEAICRAALAIKGIGGAPEPQS